jgi:hypothetical protein
MHFVAGKGNAVKSGNSLAAVTSYRPPWAVSLFGSRRSKANRVTGEGGGEGGHLGGREAWSPNTLSDDATSTIIARMTRRNHGISDPNS